jgi:hypothetical protein
MSTSAWHRVLPVLVKVVSKASHCPGSAIEVGPQVGDRDALAAEPDRAGHPHRLIGQSREQAAMDGLARVQVRLAHHEAQLHAIVELARKQWPPGVQQRTWTGEGDEPAGHLIGAHEHTF